MIQINKEVFFLPKKFGRSFIIRLFSNWFIKENFSKIWQPCWKFQVFKRNLTWILKQEIYFFIKLASRTESHCWISIWSTYPTSQKLCKTGNPVLKYLHFSEVKAFVNVGCNKFRILFFKTFCGAGTFLRLSRIL